MGEVADLVVALVVVLRICAQVVLGRQSGLRDAQGWRSEQVAVADVTANIHNASDPLVQSQLGLYPNDFIRRMAEFARSDRLSLFADHQGASEYARRGLFPELLSSVARPGNYASLSGTAVLDALVIDPIGVTSVEFRLSGGPLHDARIGTGKQSPYGWIWLWDTTAVANGTSSLRSVLVHPGGSDAPSLPITVFVRNR